MVGILYFLLGYCHTFAPNYKAIRIRMNTIDICSDFDIMAICFGAIIVCILIGYVCYKIDKHNREGK